TAHVVRLEKNQVHASNLILRKKPENLPADSTRGRRSVPLGSTPAGNLSTRIDMRDHKSKSIPNDTRPEPNLGDESAFPSWPTLPDFAFESETNDGVQIDTLAPGTKVRVQTRNSEYWLTVLEGGRRRVLIQGGILPT